MLTTTRWLMVALFFLVVVVIGVSQLMFVPTAPAATEELKMEVKQLKEEIRDLLEGNKKVEEDNKVLKEKVHELEDIAKVLPPDNDTGSDSGTSSKLKDKIKELTSQKHNLTHVVEDLQKALKEAIVSKASTQAPIIIKEGGYESPPDSVITNYDNLVSLVNNYNLYGAVRNADKFELEEDFIPIVIRVFNKHEYFGFALENYRKVKDIDKTMIIVSHDGIFPEMFKLVQQIDFCQVKQIIHPYSGHLLTNRFPGKDTSLSDVRDQYGNPRPFPETALKHHYWWHLNFVWDRFLPDHTGDMIFMEEDHVPTLDFYQTAKALAKIRDEKCANCFNAKIHQHGHSNSKIHEVFLSRDPGNVGCIMPRRSWEDLRAAGEEFCKFDDYNWDWTIAHLVYMQLIEPYSLTASFPRAEHFGKCGTHAKSGQCSIDQKDRDHFDEINRALEKGNGGDWSKYDYSGTPAGSAPGAKGWGGWAHPRDHEHCIAQIKRE